MMLSEHTADLFRYAYALLAMLTCFGFSLTLVLRWDRLTGGERLLRVGLIAEHAVLIYAAYIGLSNNYPPTLIGLGIAGALGMVVIGLAFKVYGIIDRRNDEA